MAQQKHGTCFLFVEHSFLLQLETTSVQIHLYSFYLEVLVNSKIVCSHYEKFDFSEPISFFCFRSNIFFHSVG